LIPNMLLVCFVYPSFWTRNTLIIICVNNRNWHETI
jgi:hypothetical protein